MSHSPRSIIIHGHFYQPPREDPWLEEVEREPSAAPFHDWNERIEQECYRAVVAARSIDPSGRIRRIANTLESISFDVGPTLLEWLERQAPRTYAAMLEGDRRSRQRTGGYGNALAMPFHHSILPLATRRDKITEVRWGVADFRRRFGRHPRGMWLPETAADDETLEVLAGEGIAFTILAPGQVDVVPEAGLPGVYRSASGDELAIFVYDGEISHDVAFGSLLGDAGLWAERMAARAAAGAANEPRLISVATDGETFGHHHRFGDMALAAVLEKLAAREDVVVENFESFLSRHVPRQEVRLVGPSSWSCAHGVERWRSDCGCRMAPERKSSQAWRAPLRKALDRLAAGLNGVFETEGGRLFHDPWAARDAWGELPPADGRQERGPATDPFVATHLREGADDERRIRAQELLEMERNVLRSFTSCGWFFDDIAGLEAVQVMRYAARALALAGPAAARFETRLLETLAGAVSNDPESGTGRDVYLREARPVTPPFAHLAAGIAAADRVGAAVPPDRACLAEVSGDSVRLVLRRTGRSLIFEVRVVRPALARMQVEVRPPDGAPLALGLDDLPERYREAVVRVLRGEVAGRWFSTERRAAVADGTETFAGAAVGALVDGARALRADPSADAMRRVEDLVDLLDLLGEPVPFDAVTELGLLVTQDLESPGPGLSRLAVRLGLAAPGTDSRSIPEGGTVSRIEG